MPQENLQGYFYVTALSSFFYSAFIVFVFSDGKIWEMTKHESCNFEQLFVKSHPRTLPRALSFFVDPEQQQTGLCWS